MFVGVIPQWGKTAQHVLKKLGKISQQDFDPAIDILASSQEFSSENQQLPMELCKHIPEKFKASFSIFEDHKKNPFRQRVGLLSVDIPIRGTPVSFEGAEPHNGSNLMRLNKADFAFSGLDELLIHNQGHMKNCGRQVRNWGNHNYQLQLDSEVKVFGSAGLTYEHSSGKEIQDFIGMFLIGNPRQRPVKQRTPDVFSSGPLVWIEGRYQSIIRERFPDARLAVTENVEDTVQSLENSYGIALVQTGESIKDKGLIVYGEPILQSETLLVVDYQKYKSNQPLRRVIDNLGSQEFYCDERVKNFAHWYKLLEDTLENHWIDKPTVMDMFVTQEGIDAGVRPYVKENSGWKASDTMGAHKRIEHTQYVNKQRGVVFAEYLHSNLTDFGSFPKTVMKKNQVEPIHKVLNNIIVADPEISPYGTTNE